MDRLPFVPNRLPEARLQGSTPRESGPDSPSRGRAFQRRTVAPGEPSSTPLAPSREPGHASQSAAETALPSLRDEHLRRLRPPATRETAAQRDTPSVG